MTTSTNLLTDVDLSLPSVVELIRENLLRKKPQDVCLFQFCKL